MCKSLNLEMSVSAALVYLGLFALLGGSFGQLVTPFQICEMKCIDQLHGLVVEESKDSFYAGCREYCGKHAFDFVFGSTVPMPTPAPAVTGGSSPFMPPSTTTSPYPSRASYLKFSTPSYPYPSTPSYQNPSTLIYQKASTPSYPYPTAPRYKPSTPPSLVASTPSYQNPSTPFIL